MTNQQFDKNTWQTPKYVFNWLEIKHGAFDVDGCASSENALCKEYIDSDFDFLTCSMRGFQNCCEKENLKIYVNPPYSNVKPFLIRAKELRDAGHLVVMLLNNEKSTRWYQNHVHGVANEVIDIVGERIAFIHPVTKQEIKGNSKGQMIVVFDPAMQDFAQRSVSLDFIKKIGGYDGK